MDSVKTIRLITNAIAWDNYDKKSNEIMELLFSANEKEKKIIP